LTCRVFLILPERVPSSNTPQAPACKTQVCPSATNRILWAPLINFRPTCCQPRQSLPVIPKVVCEILLQESSTRENRKPLQMT
jgi:hypothetical protein